MGVVFIPLVVVAIGSGIFLQHAAEQFNRLTEQPVYKLQTTSRLQNQIRGAYALVNNYVGTPPSTRRERFASEAQGVENIFVEILAKPFVGPREYTLLANARQEWKDSLVLAELVLAPNPPKAALSQLDQRVNRILSSC